MFPSFRIAAALALALALLPGCARSEDDIRAEFAAYVAGANACQTDGECVVASPSLCPLPCFVAVRAEREADVLAKARELVDSAQRWGQSCEYDCAVPGPVSCVANRCFVQAQGFAPPATPDAGADAP